MLTFSNDQTTLFDYVYEPIYDRARDSDLDKIQQVWDSDNLSDEFRSALLKEEWSVAHWGRPTHSMDVIIKLLILRRYYNWSFRVTEEMGNDRITVRKFLGLKDEAAPDHSVLSRWNKRIPERLWKKFNEALITVARRRGISAGRKMRFDTTVVETDIHYPTDSGLLADGIKKLGQLAKKAKRLGIAGGEEVRDFTRSAKKRVLAIVKYAGKRGEENLQRVQKYYEELVAIGKRSVTYAKKVTTTLVQVSANGDEKIARHVERLHQQYEKYIPRIEQVIAQTVRRVFHGEAVSVDEKLVSIHEAHSYPVCKGKRAKPTEFGQVVKIQEADGKMITDWESYPSQPADCNLFVPALARHLEVFKRPPHLAATDRGCWSPENERIAREKGVKRVCIPKRGKADEERKAHEKQRWFRQGQRFRAGSEATISILKRRYGMDRCREEGQGGMDNWVALSCIARNLWTIVHAMA